MLKLFRSWKFVFLATIFLLYILYFSITYQDELALPSEGWSRNLTISELNINNINDAIQNNNIFTLPIPSESSFINFWFDSNTIHYSLISDEGENVLNDKLDLNIESIKKVRAIYTDDLIALYSLENKNLKKYEFNYKTKEIFLKETIATPVKDFVINEDLLIYSANDSLTIIDTSDNSQKIENVKVEKFEITKDSISNLCHIVFSEKDTQGNRFINYITYDLNSKEINLNRITPVASSTNLSLEGLDIGIVNNTINILASISDKKFGTNNLYHIRFPQNSPSSFSKNLISINSEGPNPRILKDKTEEFSFIASVNVTKGKENKTVNLVKFTLDSNSNITDKQLLSKVDALSQNPYYFTLNKHNYLVWTAIQGKNKRILFASNKADIVKASQKLDNSEIFDLFMATITSLIPSFIITLMPIVNIFVPTIFAIFIVSIVNLKWIENYSLKRFSIIIAIHSILKIIYSNSSILSDNEVVDFLPIFLKNPVSFYSLLILTTLISLYCIIDYYKSNRQSLHIVKLYSFYAFFDLTIYCFLTVPYIYSYLLLSYRLNIF